jgi:hypothetical protein
MDAGYDACFQRDLPVFAALGYRPVMVASPPAERLAISSRLLRWTQMAGLLELARPVRPEPPRA